MTNSYGAMLERCETTPETEARLLREISRELEAADGGADFRGPAGAVHRNRRLWTLFAMDLAQPANPLPLDLKARLLSMATAVDRSCSDALAGDRTAVAAMVEINRNLAAALA